MQTKKTKCSGGVPCEACAQRSSPCVYDISSDRRKKIVNQRMMQNLAQAQDNLERHQQLIGGMIASLRVATILESDALLQLIRSGVDMSQLAAHVRNTVRMNPQAQEEFDTLDFVIDGARELPSPDQLLNEFPARNPGPDQAAAPDLIDVGHGGRSTNRGGF